MRRKTENIKNIDWTTVLIYFTLVVLGWINIYAAVYNEAHGSILDMSQRYGKQLVWISIAVVLIIIIFLIDAKFYDYFAYFIYAGMIILLLAVLIFGTKVHGARSWFQIGAFRFQPAEFAKLATTLALAKMLSIYGFSLKKYKDLIKALALTFFPAVLIVLQNDTGSALVYASLIIVFYREGLPSWIVFLGILLSTLFISALLINISVIFIILPVIALISFYFLEKNLKYTLYGLLTYLFFLVIIYFLNLRFNKFSTEYVYFYAVIITFIVLAFYAYKYKVRFYAIISVILIISMAFTFSVDYIFNNMLEKHQQTRINVLLGIEKDPSGVEYNVNQSKIAIGSGGFSGKGFLQGTQTKFDFVPEQDTDFIFCTVGEEWGFIGTTTVILLFSFLLLRIIFLAEKQKNKFGRIYGYGVASILFFHIIINIGMTIGLAPVIGIPLPFFSYGGSSLWGFTLLLFIFLRLDAANKQL